MNKHLRNCAHPTSSRAPRGTSNQMASRQFQEIPRCARDDVREVTRPLLLTSGEPAGIGPDLCLLLPMSSLNHPVVILGDQFLLQARAKQLGLDVSIAPYDPASPPTQDELMSGHHLWVWHVPVKAVVECGQLNPLNGAYVLQLLELAVDACLRGQFGALVTAPVHKAAINQAGFPFSGHTEWLAERAGVDEVVMLLVCEAMRVALVTTHLPLSQVAAAITSHRLVRVIQVVEEGLRTQFGIAQPRLLVAGLNPHAGESGHLGREEIDIIEPVIQRFKQRGMDIQGPLPADTLFTPTVLKESDAVISMYHDQGLPVLKYAGFGEAVNVTLGLPFIRTSVDHGTALPLAGTGNVRVSSLVAALKLAVELGTHRRSVV
ncbi:MAG: 4-hydroxythreonine-4-phosphate dehydrogenase PdxA [Gammaproteobacteria bacterium]|nr:4-hydroxythreonine-4-phosphate dehydrogenase PdxA [Gammaproteobacteria bacterium]